MHLILFTQSPAPSKNTWHNPDPQSRRDWSDIYEAITTWFCSSHDFNKEDDLVIIYENSLIKFEGKTIRYLGPSLRSAASLTHKAFLKLQQLDADGVEESTPGIFVYQNKDKYKLPVPFYQLKFTSDMTYEKKLSNYDGSLFTFYNKQAQEYYAPASRIGQGLVWFLQERFK